MTRLYLVTWKKESQYRSESAYIVAESMGEAVNIWRVVSQNDDGEPEGVKLQIANVYGVNDKPGAEELLERLRVECVAAGIRLARSEAVRVLAAEGVDSGIRRSVSDALTDLEQDYEEDGEE